MADHSAIAWTDATWNPVTGCTKVSPGCDHCYAERIAETKRGTPAFPVGFDVQLRPHKLKDPLRWKTPRRVFVNSMSDLFHRAVPDEYLRTVWDTMLEADHHTYQVLTKRPHRMAHKVRTLGLQPAAHIWLGTSAEDQRWADSRIPALLSIDTQVRFVSAEPLLGAIDLTPWLGGLAWVIAGGESGPGRRSMELAWARSLRDQCYATGTAYFYKQGNAFRSGQDRYLDGRTWDEFPDA